MTDEKQMEEPPIRGEETDSTPAMPGKPESKFKSFVRRLVRWTVGVLIVLGLGALALYLGVYRPRQAELKQQLGEAQTQISTQQDRITALEAQVADLTPLEAANKTLQEALTQAELHLKLLSALSDVRGAQFALALGNLEDARLQLTRTPETLAALRDGLPADEQAAVDSMLGRLQLVLDEMETDAFAAQSDMDVVVNSLIQLENTLFITP